MTSCIFRSAIYSQLMKFAPEYVTYVLNENFEDAKALFLSPLMAIHYAHLVMLAAQGIVSPADARALREALDGVSQDDDPRVHLRRHLRGSVLLRRAADRRGLRRRRRRPAAHRAQPQRHRHDDVPDAAARVHPRAAGRHASSCAARCSTSPTATATRSSPSTRTRSAPSRRPSRTTCWRSIEQLERDAARLRGGLRAHEPQSARRLRDHRHRVSDRSAADLRSARLLRADRQHLRQHRHGRLPAREHVGGGGAARRPRPLRAGPAPVVHRGVRLPAPRRRLRAVQQHHAAEAQPGRARARARHRQQGARPGAGDRHQPSTTRRSATSSTPRTTCSRSCSRCSATRRGR